MEKHELIQNLLEERGIETEVLVFDKTTRTSQDAANQVGCSLGQIAKSIVFKLIIEKTQQITEEPVLVIASGSNRVSEEKIVSLLAEKLKQDPTITLRLEKADAEFVYEKTGFPIGGVPALGHKNPIKYVFFDQDLLNYQTIWSAAGTPFAVYEITPKNLVKISMAEIVEIKG